MEKAVKPTKRKIIDLKPETFRSLSIMAAKKGTNLKHLIETTLDEIAAASGE
ncbi:MAG: hypothetical protein IK011_06725 [Bacteroidaceae bacterium]|nr:hypothetical protein [Bacteroidaceae bacterium]MBR4779562.1 hypothetical protein [Bacteroidaceae bacterium]